ncbi:nickel/cobalt transporter [Streptomyces sp. NPDC059095]|uniref:nickel/cobalt transporter n=1 Tax=Streptomyces sp. NPDC059095 TaxID=3346726 RepID=UPI00367DAE50
MNPMLRRTTTATVTVALASAVLLPQAHAALAHPLGNFTVNYHTGLTLRADRVDAKVIVDRAEISTLQERPRIDLDHDGATSPAEADRYSKAACTALGRQLHADVRERPVGFNQTSHGLTYEPGQAGLNTSWLTCTYTAPADLSQAADVAVRTTYDTQRIGWREMTVRGQGLAITGTELPATSPTDELRHYPPDPTTSPLDQHTAHLHTQPGATASTPGAAALPGGSWATGISDAVSSRFDALIGGRQLTIPVGLLAVLLALVLGASHAVLPGHGKTIMAAYLAGRRGTKRDAVTVGATVTFTHTAGVLVLGLALPTATHLAGETVLNWLGAASGLIVTGIGLWLLTTNLRGRPSHGHHHDHHHGTGHHHHHHGYGHRHGDDHGDNHHHHDDELGHDHGHGHHDNHEQGHPVAPEAPLRTRARLPQRRRPATPQHGEPSTVATLTKPETWPSDSTQPHQHGPARRQGRGGLIGMGIAGGLVPSPSALVVLLGAVALGRTAFGVFLVIAYGLGMAATLTAAGLLLVRLRDHLETRTTTLSNRSQAVMRHLARIGPVMTAVLVVIVGAGLTITALAPTI